MAFDMSSMGGLFAPNQTQQPGGVQPNLWPFQQHIPPPPSATTAGGLMNFDDFPALLNLNQFAAQQQQQQTAPPPSQFAAAAFPAAFAAAAAAGNQQQQQLPQPVQLPPQNIVSQGVDNGGAKADTIQGIGVLTWLSAKAGLITCKDQMVISFQLKDFCDQMLNDLTSVLRVGFTLSFHAALNETSEYTATIVQPIYGPEAELVFRNSNEVDLESANPTPANSKDAYSPSIEARAIPALLAIFQRHGLQQIQLSSLHSQMSNCGDEELFRYVGTSSLKRRQFVERRTHIFRLQNDDSIILQFPSVYVAVYKLALFLLRHGGATSIQSLFDYYIGSDIAQEIRDHNGDGRQDFLNLLNSHNWVFALFPNRTYVSVRRNLPNYDYPAFIKQHFPEFESRRTIHKQMSSYGAPQNGAGPRGIQRTMSVQMSASNGANSAVAAAARQSLLQMQQQQQQVSNASRPINLWDSQSATSVNPVSTASDQWSPLFSPTTWSNTRPPPPPMNSATSNVNETLLSGANFSALLSLAQSQRPVMSRGVQSEFGGSGAIGIGRNGCTCSCTCGRGGISNVNNVGVIGNRGSSSRASGGSASPPSIDSNSPFDRFSPLNAVGSIGDRLLSSSNQVLTDLTSVTSSGPATSSSTNSTGQQQQQPRYYDPFGTTDILNGAHLSSLRIGN
ncbi:unnamed protein product [Caenorhabditis angaria]|uniref:Lin-66-like winged helix domain-containing protein n=1 Tax=Caenorhabditis angaria TaxID=860376 RepID=A0A9P1IM25_9PELO|nr:unnamed protein product [Caenorhabditis angaria]